MDKLSKMKCIPCQKGEAPLKGEELSKMTKQISSGWKIIDEHHLEKQYSFDNFQQALIFTNKLGEISEKEGHHPDIYLSYGKVKVQIWTHKIQGLSKNDFILAAKFDEISI